MPAVALRPAEAVVLRVLAATRLRGCQTGASAIALATGTASQGWARETKLGIVLDEAVAGRGITPACILTVAAAHAALGRVEIHALAIWAEAWILIDEAGASVALLARAPVLAGATVPDVGVRQVGCNGADLCCQLAAIHLHAIVGRTAIALQVRASRILGARGISMCSCRSLGLVIARVAELRKKLVNAGAAHDVGSAYHLAEGTANITFPVTEAATEIR